MVLMVTGVKNGSRRKKAVLGNRGGRSSKERFLKAEDHGGIRGNELAKILLMGTKTTNIPLKNRHDQ